MGKKSEPTPNSDVAVFVRAAREKTGLSGDAIGAIFDCTRGNVSGWENGRHEPPYSTLCKLSDMSGIPLPGQKDAWPFKTIERDEFYKLEEWQRQGIEAKLTEFIKATNAAFVVEAEKPRKSSNGG